MGPNAYDTLLRRRHAATLTWHGPALMLFARAACAVGAQALVAAAFALRSSPTPWRDAAPWLPVYGTLIDAGCLTLLWRLTRREGIRLFDLVSFDRAPSSAMRCSASRSSRRASRSFSAASMRPAGSRTER
jgi:hypothetical protein